MLLNIKIIFYIVIALENIFIIIDGKYSARYSEKSSEESL